jgi:hypothetical protein
LSPNEAKLLQDNLNFIKNQDARLRAAGGGELTDPQKDELHRLFDQTSEMIYNKKHNPMKAIWEKSFRFFKDQIPRGWRQSLFVDSLQRLGFLTLGWDL